MTSQSMNPVDVLPAGTALAQYLITGLIGQGGFGVVYLARDTESNRTVAIKEFLPTAIAARGSRGEVLPRNSDLTNAFASGVKGFLREAYLLSEFSHPALVAVHKAWEQNGTAYMAMQYYPGKTLREVRKTGPLANRRPTEARIQGWMSPVLEAVSELHAHRVIHRDISPDNVLVMANGDTVLLDLGAARQVLGGMTQALTTILKPGFAPIEQYVEDGSMEQGRWTDIYGLGAVIYFLVTGQAPTPATSRIVRDNMPPLAALAPRDLYSPHFFNAVAKALSLRAIDRFKSIAEFRTALGWVIQPRAVPVATERTTTSEPLTEAQISAVKALPLDEPVAAARANASSKSSKPAGAAKARKADSMAELRGKAQSYEALAQSASKIVIGVVIAIIVAVAVVFALS
jgi:non-specific serine/threonine protein kinase